MALQVSESEYRRLSKRADVRIAKRRKTELHDQLRREVEETRNAFTYVLDVPPSANHLFLNVRGKGRVMTKAYRMWIKKQLGELMVQRAKPCAVPASVEITLPAHINGDADNRIKPTIDLIVRAGILPGDRSDCVRSILTIFAPVESMHVKVEGVTS